MNRRADGMARAGTDVPCWNGNTLSLQEPPRERLRCLTNSSSATEAGKKEVEKQERRGASLCSLERVVRRLGVGLEAE